MDLTRFFPILKILCEGLGVVFQLFLVTILVSLPLGFCFTLIAKSKFRPLAWVVNAYIFVVRSTPLLLQLFFVYYGLPFISKALTLDPMAAGMITFSLNYAAYFAEIFRGGLLSIDKGQYEACQVLGISKFSTMTKVIIPQMIRVTLPSIGNEAITLIKDTALVSAISIMEVLNLAKKQVNGTGDITAYLVAFVIYLVINSILTIILKQVEKKYDFGGNK